MDNNSKLKIAWFSDFFSPDTLSAYFSGLILPHLKDKFDITLYHNSFERHGDFPTHHYLKAFEHDRSDPYDIFFYQLEDDPRLNFVRSHLGLKPGITYFHHFNLGNYGPEPLLNSPYTDIVEKFNSKNDTWPDRSKKYKPKGPGAFREAALSPVAIFSNPHSLDEYKRQVSLKLKVEGESGLNAFYLPYPVRINSKKQEALDGVFRIAFIGSTRIENRAHKVLSAISKLDAAFKLTWVVPAPEQDEAVSLLEEYGIQNAELNFAYNPASWERVTAAADCAVHTLFSVYGHSDPYLGISLSQGLPCLVTNFASTETLPDKLVFKIQPGDSEALQIAEILNSIEKKAVSVDVKLIENYCNENSNASQIASELASIFLKRKHYLKDLRQVWDGIELNAKRSLVNENYHFLENSGEVARKMVEPVFGEMGWLK